MFYSELLDIDLKKTKRHFQGNGPVSAAAAAAGQWPTPVRCSAAAAIVRRATVRCIF